MFTVEQKIIYNISVEKKKYSRAIQPQGRLIWMVVIYLVGKLTTYHHIAVSFVG